MINLLINNIIMITFARNNLNFLDARPIRKSPKPRCDGCFVRE